VIFKGRKNCKSLRERELKNYGIFRNSRIVLSHLVRKVERQETIDQRKDVFRRDLRDKRDKKLFYHEEPKDTKAVLAVFDLSRKTSMSLLQTSLCIGPERFFFVDKCPPKTAGNHFYIRTRDQRREKKGAKNDGKIIG
jgi:hypothetical protein